MTYPKTLFKADGGNWKHQQVHSVDEEEAARANGFQLPEQLWPDAPATSPAETKTRVAGDTEAPRSIRRAK